MLRPDVRHIFRTIKPIKLYVVRLSVCEFFLLIYLVQFMAQKWDTLTFVVCSLCRSISLFVGVVEYPKQNRLIWEMRKVRYRRSTLL